MAGKGDLRRPAQVTEAELAERWRRAFGYVESARERIEHQREAKARRIGQLDLFEWQGPLPLQRPAQTIGDHANARPHEVPAELRIFPVEIVAK
jgi:hypothetical protein